MGKNNTLMVLTLTLVWVVLAEDISWRTVAIGMIVGMACVSFAGKFLPFKVLTDVNFLRLITFPFYLIGRIYISGIDVIKLILTDAKSGIIKVKTDLKSESTRIMLADSLTLTPGSVILELNDDIITLLCIGTRETEDFADAIKGMRRLENRLRRAQK